MSSFFQKRLARHQKKMMKYMRYVLNDHFVLVCLFLIGGVGLYYSNWLKTLQPPFAIGGLIGCIRSINLSIYSQMFLKLRQRSKEDAIWILY